MRIEEIDRKLEERALRAGWNISSNEKSRIVAKTVDRATCGIPEIEEGATRTLIAMEALELKTEIARQRSIEADHARKLQLIEAAIRLGIIDAQRPGIGVASIEPSES